MSGSFHVATRRLVLTVLLAAVTTLLCLLSPSPAAAQRPPTSASHSEMQQAVQSYRLSTDDLQKVTTANDRLATGMTNNPAAVQELMLEGERTKGMPLDEMVKRAEANPVISSAVHSAGLDVRGYLVAMSSMVVANAYSQMMQRNPQMAAKMSGMISPAQAENIKLLQAHPTEAKAFEQSLEKLKQINDEMERRAHGSGGK